MVDLYVGFEPVEYFCNGCGQLRLSIDDFDGICKHCGSTDVITGAVNSLDKEALKKGYEDGQRTG